MQNSQTISPEYLNLNKQMHEGNFGGGGYKRIPHILPVIKEFGIKTILDYGCGQGTLAIGLEEAKKNGVVEFDSICNYDPARREYSKKPTGVFDLVCCTDVLEHIEPDYLDNVIEDLYQYTGKVAYLFIACSKANKVLPDGRNAHLIQEGPHWWMSRLISDKTPWAPWGSEKYLDKDNPGSVKKFMVFMKKQVAS